MNKKSITIGCVLLFNFNISLFCQNQQSQIQSQISEKNNYTGKYILNIKGSIKKNDPQLPSGNLLLYRINDSLYKIKLRYAGAPPAKNLGIIDDTIIISNNVAIYSSKEDKTCKIKFQFSNNSVKIDQQSQSHAFACGFGRNVHIDGEYIKDITASNTLTPLKAGKIGVTLHWIGWERRGIANITDPKNGFFQIQGKQTDKDSDDFIEIMGILHQSSLTEITFEGIIKTRVSYINKGIVCERKGKYTFVAKPGKKYWRLKEQENCEGNMVVDYIDLYF